MTLTTILVLFATLLVSSCSSDKPKSAPAAPAQVKANPAFYCTSSILAGVMCHATHAACEAQRAKFHTQKCVGQDTAVCFVTEGERVCVGTLTACDDAREFFKSANPSRCIVSSGAGKRGIQMSKRRIMISIDPRSLELIDKRASDLNMNRSQYLEWAGLQEHSTALTAAQRKAIASAIHRYVQHEMTTVP